MVLQFLNIKAWMLALSIVAGWIAGRSARRTERTLQVLPLMLAFAFVSNLTYARPARCCASGWPTGGACWWFNRCMAAVLVLTAVWMLRSAP